MAHDEWIKYVYNPIFAFISLVTSFGFFIWFIYSRWKHYPVNCWFCNLNSKVHFKLRNSWICLHCQQYNGFTPDGDYNQSLYQNIQSNDKVMYNCNKFPPRPASNGLCHKCNTNQQLKVMQLANFKPLNKNKFDMEVDQFRLHLEEVYKLCKKCKKYLNAKLQNEKGPFLKPKKNLSKNMIKTKTSATKNVEAFFKNLSLKLAYVFLIVAMLDIGFNANLFFSKKIIRLAKQHFNSMSNVENYNKLLSESTTASIHRFKEVISNLTIVEHSINIFNKHVEYEGLVKFLTAGEHRDYAIKLFLEILILLHVMVQIITMCITRLRNMLRVMCNICIWLLSGYLVWNGDKYLLLVQVILSSLFIWNVKTASVNKNDLSNQNNNVKVWKNMKNLSNNSQMSQCSDEDLISEDSDEDDDHILQQNRTSTPEYLFQNQNYNFSDRSQITRPYGFQFDNSPYSQLSSRYNSPLPKSPYNNYNVNNFTMELDRGIGKLSLENKDIWSNYGSQTIFAPNSYGSPNSNGGFLLRRPILSPSKFVYSTQQSWVAGGYWGTESPKKLHPSHDTSRSSSQSSGFESMVSGNCRKSYFTPIDKRNKSDDICDKSVYGNVFLNVNALPVMKSKLSKTLFDSSMDLNGSRLEKSKHFKGICFHS